MRVEVHSRVTAKRPEIAVADALDAFATRVAARKREGTDPMRWVGVGIDGHGRVLQWVAVDQGADAWLVIHCSPATVSVLEELGIGQRRKP
jgi:hypothetical protein